MQLNEGWLSVLTGFTGPGWVRTTGPMAGSDPFLESSESRYGAGSAETSGGPPKQYCSAEHGSSCITPGDTSASFLSNTTAFSMQSNVEAPVYGWDPNTQKHFRIPSQFDSFPWFHAKDLKKYWPPETFLQTTEFCLETQLVLQRNISKSSPEYFLHECFWETSEHIPVKSSTKTCWISSVLVLPLNLLSMRIKVKLRVLRAMGSWGCPSVWLPEQVLPLPRACGIVLTHPSVPSRGVGFQGHSNW